MYRNIETPKGSAMIIKDRISRKYIVDISLAEGFLVLTNDGGAYFADARYFSAVKNSIAESGLTPILYTGLESVAAFLKEKNVSVIYLDYDKTTVSEYNEVFSLSLKIKDLSGILKERRGIKDEKEIKLIKIACEIAEKSYHNSIKKVKLGMTEKQLAEIIENEMVEMGADGSSFETIVAFGKNGAVPHHVTGETTLQKDMPILVDMGAKYRGYCSDITRMAYFGVPDEEFLWAYEGVLIASIRAEKEITDQMTCQKADGIAREELVVREFGQYFTHSLGHGVGMEIHEYPTLSKKSKDVLQNGMVFTIEPGVYLDGKFGIRIEDTALLKNGKVERLFSDSKELIVIK